MSRNYSPICDIQLEGTAFTRTEMDVTDLGLSGSQLELADHLLTWDDEFASFECQRCGETADIPKIFKASTDFRKIVYQLIIFAHFKNKVCHETEDTIPEWYKDYSDGSDDTTVPPLPTSPQKHRPHDIMWMNTDSSDDNLVTENFK